MSIGDNIKSIRQTKGITQKELAEMVEVSPSMIWQYENGYRVPRGMAFIRLVIALDTNGITLSEGEKDFPLSAAMIDPLRCGDDSVLEFARKLGKKIPEKKMDADSFEKLPDSVGDKILGDLINEKMVFQDVGESLGIYKIIVRSDDMEMLEIYRKLNDEGKIEARKRISELAMLSKYVRSDKGPASKIDQLVEAMQKYIDLV